MKKLIVGNWKMYPKTIGEARRIVKGIVGKVPSGKLRGMRVVVCPPAIYLGELSQTKKIIFGAQNIFGESEGAHTGEISPEMVRSLGIAYTIVGHSERRAGKETDEEIAQKIKVATGAKLTVILCVGEKSRDADGTYFTFVREQLHNALAGLASGKAPQIVVAYEPVWAIGKNALRPATPEDTREMVLFIRKHLVEIFGKSGGRAIPILYGGSVDRNNAMKFLTEGTADGLLIGRVSLNAEEFSFIATEASKLT